MITIIDAQIYSTNNEIAYQIEYSDSTIIRVVEGKEIIRSEYKKNGEWIQSGTPYIVNKNKKRQNERLKQTVLDFLK